MKTSYDSKSWMSYKISLARKGREIQDLSLLFWTLRTTISISHRSTTSSIHPNLVCQWETTIYRRQNRSWRPLLSWITKTQWWWITLQAKVWKVASFLPIRPLTTLSVSGLPMELHTKFSRVTQVQVFHRSNNPMQLSYPENLSGWNLIRYFTLSAARFGTSSLKDMSWQTLSSQMQLPSKS